MFVALLAFLLGVANIALAFVAPTTPLNLLCGSIAICMGFYAAADAWRRRMARRVLDRLRRLGRGAEPEKSDKKGAWWNVERPSD